LRGALRGLIAELPGVSRLRALRYEKKVRRTADWRFWGLFSSYEEALAAAPDNPVLNVGYDTPGIADRGHEDYERMHTFDYPALVWLALFAGATATGEVASGCTVVDLGGHLGFKYRAFLRYWTPPTDFRWVVCETPATVEAAERLPASARSPGLSFTTDTKALDGARILHASGVLAYLDRDLWEILDDVEVPPQHLILNKVPLARGAEFWTVQNASGLAAVPYHVFNRDVFLEQLAARGYRVVDEWNVPQRTVEVPFHPGLGTDSGTGLSLTRSPDDLPAATWRPS
jgi:putative methyltransferase (TIGR04325 family)